MSPWPSRPSSNPIIHPEEILRSQHGIVAISQRADPLAAEG